MNNEEKKVVLNEKLKEVLETVGDTPFKEPEIFKALDSEKPNKMEAIKIALSRKDLNVDDFSAKEIAEFLNVMRYKIIDLKLPDGTYKSTDNTKDYKFPTYSQVDKLSDLGFKLTKLYEKQVELDDEEAIKANRDLILKSLGELDTFLWEITGLNKDDLTAWEVELLSEQIFAYSSEVEKTSMGKRLNT